MNLQNHNPAEVKASSPIRTSLSEREGSMWGSLKRPSPRPSLLDECRSDDSELCHDGRIGDSWVSTMLKARYPSAAPYICIEHCLFGLHQLSLYEDMPIGIVESERSAVILSEAQPQLLWLAYIYPANLTVNQFEPLQGRKVTLYPRADRNQTYYWAALELADQVKRVYDIDISVSSFLDDTTTPAQQSANIDLVDYLFENQ